MGHSTINICGRQAWPWRGRNFVGKADERGHTHHRGIASCLNIINDDVSINASFIFNTIQFNLINTTQQPNIEPTMCHHDTVVKTTDSIVQKVPTATPTPQTLSTSCW